MSRGTAFCFVVLGFAGVIGISACGISIDEDPNVIAVPEDVFPVEVDDPLGGIPTLNITRHPVFFISDGLLVEVARELPAPVFLDGPLNNLLAGPNALEASEGFESAIPVGTVLVDVQLLRNNTIALHLNEVFYAVEGEQRIRATAQLVFTASALAANTQGVFFFFDGRTQFLPDGTGTIAQLGEGGQPRALRVEDFPALVPPVVQVSEDDETGIDESSEPSQDDS